MGVGVGVNGDRQGGACLFTFYACIVVYMRKNGGALFLWRVYRAIL